MNHFLVSVLGVINAAVAILIVLVFATEGGHWATGDVRHWDPGGVIVGLILGIVVAVVICGLLAIAISIEKSVGIIADSMVSGSVRIEPSGAMREGIAQRHSNVISLSCASQSREAENIISLRR